MRVLLPQGSGRVWLTLACLLWLGAVCAGMKWLLDYQERAGSPALAPRIWPDSSHVPRATQGPTLLAFAHPRCACTRATLTELARLMAHTRGRLAVHLLFVVPRGLPAVWAQADLWRSARGIPDLDVATDTGGVEARRFGVKSSGQMLLYSRDGHLLFAGGITPGRGHEGDSAGADAIEQLVAQQPAARTTTPVFGCELDTPTVAGARRRAAQCSVK